MQKNIFLIIFFVFLIFLFILNSYICMSTFDPLAFFDKKGGSILKKLIFYL